MRRARAGAPPPRSRRRAPGTAAGRAGPSTTADLRRSACRGSVCVPSPSASRAWSSIGSTPEDGRTFVPLGTSRPGAARSGRTGLSVAHRTRPYPGSVNDRFLRALRREPVDRTPVWFMRQAGRYLAEYRELRGDRDILDAIREPEVAVELTLQPLRRMPLDAAIVFADIMVPVAAIGVSVRIESGVGPIVDDPIRDPASVARLRALESDVDEPYVAETIRLLRKELGVPLIGFAGAPFTLASYLVEGGSSRDHVRTKALMHDDPATWSLLMDALASVSRAHLLAQIEAGAQAVQL